MNLKYLTEQPDFIKLNYRYVFLELFILKRGIARRVLL